MRSRKVLAGVFVSALIVAIALIAARAYYVAVAVIAGILLIGYREIWSLITTRKLPPLDERIRENTNKSVRNGFIFFILALGYFMFPFAVRIIEQTDISIVLGGIFMAGGAVYCLSYLYYDRAEPKLSEKALKVLKGSIYTIAISIAVFILGALFHNLIFAFFDIEEPVFFVLAGILAPLGVAVGIIGCIVIFIQGIFARGVR